MKASDAAIALIKKFEGFRDTAYLCPAGVPTIGYGTTLDVRMGDKITEEQAEAFLKRDIQAFEKAVSSLVTVPLTQNQFDALVCWTYNLGPTALKSSTLLKCVNQRLFGEVPEQIMRWTMAKGRVLPGLVKRRVAEASMWKGI